jgi:PPOX class probable F420-dependent enzyme
MGSRRDAIRMSEDEAYAFLSAHKVGVLGTVGPRNVPHMVNVGYLVDGRRLVFTSFAAAQKVRNIERAGQASLLVEIAWPYNEVKGVLVSGPTTIVTDTDHVIDVTSRMKSLHAEMSGTSEGTPEIDVAKYAPKRVAIYIEPERVVSWDHTRLGGTY